MNNIKDCMNCKYSFYDSLDNNLWCRLKNNQILCGVLDEEFDDHIPCVYYYSHLNICENFELEEVKK